MKNKQPLSLSTMIYLTTVGIFVLMSLLIKDLELGTVLSYALLTGMMFILFKRKWNFINPAISIFSFMYITAELPNYAMMMTNQDPSFIISSVFVGFFSVLLIGNLVSHPELSIRSPWVANYLGLFGLFVSELSLLIYIEESNMEGLLPIVLTGAVGALVHILIGFSYLAIGKKVKVNKPKLLSDNPTAIKFTELIEDNGYTRNEYTSKKGNVITHIDSKSKTGQSVRLIFIDGSIYEDKSNKREQKKISRFKLNESGEIKNIYSWLYSQAVNSFERKKEKSLKREMPIIVQINPTATESHYQIIEIPLPRSKNKSVIGVLTLNNNITPENKKTFDKLVIDMSLVNDGY